MAVFRAQDDKSVERLIFVRHGATLWNEERRYQGQRDTFLNDLGRRQAEQVAEALAGARAQFLVSSDLMRAKDTAAIIGESLKLAVVTSSLWRERDYGRWEGLTRPEIQELHPEEWRQYRSNPANAAPLGGETLTELKARAIQAVAWVLGKYQGQSGVIVSHGGLLRALLAWIANQERPQFHLDNGGISVVEAPSIDKLRIVIINDTSHLVDL
jgi:broad specificity phosphatase PhoE